MVRFTLALLPAAVLALAAGGGRSAADDKDKASGRKYDHVERIVARLQLDDKQKEALRKIEKEFDAKADPVEHQMWGLHHEEHEAMRNVLTEQQRAQVPEFFKRVRDQEMMKIANELNLNDQQRMKIAAICESNEPRFKKLAEEKNKDERTHQQFRDLRRELVSEIREQLNPEQREKLPAVVREEHRFWHNAMSHHEHYAELGDKLGVSAQQKEQFRKLHEEYDPKVKALHSELRKLHREELTAIENVLTPEQKTRFQEMCKGHVSSEKGEQSK